MKTVHRPGFKSVSAGFTFFGKEPLGFTLVEILIAISIFSILSVIGYSTFAGSQKRALEYRLNSDFHDIEVRIKEGEVDQGKTVAQMLIQYSKNHVPPLNPGSSYNYDSWTDMNCIQGIGSITSLSCINDQLLAWQQFTGNPNFKASDIPKDPWGHIYALDANEYETTFTYQFKGSGPPINDLCRWDTLRSAGRDGVLGGSGFPGNSDGGTKPYNASTDDYIYFVRPYNASCTAFKVNYCAPGTILGGAESYAGTCN